MDPEYITPVARVRGDPPLLQSAMDICGDYAFRVFDRHPRGKRDIVEDQSKVELLPPMCTITFIYDIL